MIIHLPQYGKIAIWVVLIQAIPLLPLHQVALGITALKLLFQSDEAWFQLTHWPSGWGWLALASFSPCFTSMRRSARAAYSIWALRGKDQMFRGFGGFSFKISTIVFPVFRRPKQITRAT